MGVSTKKAMKVHLQRSLLGKLFCCQCGEFSSVFITVYDNHGFSKQQCTCEKE